MTVASTQTYTPVNENSLRNKSEDSFLLDLSKKLSALDDKNKILDILHLDLKKAFYFSQTATTINDWNSRTYSGFIIDSRSRTLIHPDYTRIVTKKYSLDDKVMSKVLQSSMPVIFDLDELVKDDSSPEWVYMNYESGIREVVMAPQIANGQQIGTFCILSDRKNEIEFEHVRLIQTVALQLSILIAGFLTNESLSRIRDNHRKILELGTEFSNIENKEELFRLIVAKYKQFFGSAQIIVHWLTENGKYYEPVLFDPAFFDLQEQLPVSTDEVLNSDSSVFLKELYDLQNTMIVSGETGKNLEYLPEFLQLEKWPYIRQILISPLRRHGGYKGFLSLYMDHQLNLTDYEQNILKSVSAQLAFCLDDLLLRENFNNHKHIIENYNGTPARKQEALQDEPQTVHPVSILPGNSLAMKKVAQLAKQVARSNSSVLLLGETGTGKELIAREIHNNSSRRQKKMITVNCAAMPAPLIESELFGHERGSFTGAVDRRIGKFELADNSTLFLDEIGELAPELQAKLLRVIQEREIERIGGSRIIKSDFRIIAATNRNLIQEVESGRFRSDLYFRLNVFPIYIPPLRQRKDDILILIKHFLKKFAHLFPGSKAGFSPMLVDELLQYPWPGNVRELEHFVEKHVILFGGQTITKINLPLFSCKAFPSVDNDKIKTLQEVEREHISMVIKFCNGKVAGPRGAARLLNMPSTTLNSKMKRLGINRP